MAKKGDRKPRPVYGDPTDPRGMAVMIAAFLEYLGVRAYTPRTIKSTEERLVQFLLWCQERDIQRPQDVSRPVLLRYQRHLFHKRKPDGQPLTFTTQQKALVTLKMFFRFLSRQNYIPANPASELELPRLEKRLPRHVLSASEVERVLAVPDVTTPLGLRDRAIMETFYSTGLRRSELIELSLYDVDLERRLVTVRLGKGRKDRVVPIGERAAAWVSKYTLDVRPQLVLEPDRAVLFLTYQGFAFAPDCLSKLVSQYVDASGIGKTGACHLFRHAMATLMLENGADVRFIQEMLGHASLESTQIYTQVSIIKLRQIHAATHPAASLTRSTAPDLDEPKLGDLARHDPPEDLALEALEDLSDDASSFPSEAVPSDDEDDEDLG
jgi:integrase/recombinase XerD